MATELIVEGLSVRLDSYENAMKKDLVINIEPRVNFEINGMKPIAKVWGANPTECKDEKLHPHQHNSIAAAATKKPYGNYYERKLDEAE
jgi:hypothetical protein